MGKSKFNVGDKVRYKSKTNSKIYKTYTIGSIRYDATDKRTVYTLKECPDTYFVYSYQLEKVGASETLECGTINENTSKSIVTLEFDKTTLDIIDSENRFKFKNCANKIIVDGVVIKNRYGDIDKNTRAFKLTLEEAQEMYNAGGKLREFALRVFTEDELKPKPKYPTTWDDYCDNFYPYEKHVHYTPQFAHGFYGEEADAFIAYGKLIRLRRAWINDWKPNFYMNMASNWGIEYEPNPGVFRVENHCRTNGGGLTFPTKEMAENFMNCFKDLLNKAKTLI